MNRFWEKVDKTPGFGPAGDCWRWTGSIHWKGYGKFGLDGRTQRAHRVAFELVNGPVPPGLYILHSCDNRSCVNPAHLRTGTAGDNMQDKVERDRCPSALRYTRPTCRNTNGVLGVSKNGNGWQAKLEHSGRRRWKWFASFEDAVRQRKAWEQEHSK